MDIGTIGNAPCEIALSNMLNRLDDPKITRRIMSGYYDLKNGLNALKTVDIKFRKRMMQLLIDDVSNKLEASFGRIDWINSDLRGDIFTHAKCCYRALYRRALAT